MLRLNLVLTHGIPPDFRGGGVHLSTWSVVVIREKAAAAPVVTINGTILRTTTGPVPADTGNDRHHSYAVAWQNELGTESSTVRLTLSMGGAESESRRNPASKHQKNQPDCGECPAGWRGTARSDLSRETKFSRGANGDREELRPLLSWPPDWYSYQVGPHMKHSSLFMLLLLIVVTSSSQCGFVSSILLDRTRDRSSY